MSLTDPVNKQNVVNRFAEFVQTRANESIVWGTNNMPKYFTTSTFGGTTAGKTVSITGSNLNTTEINAANIYDVLRTETTNFSNIRNLRARINVTGAGGNTPLGPERPANPGIIFDQTNKAHLSTAYLQAVQSPSNAGVESNNLIARSNLDGFITNLRSVYDSYRNNTITITVNVCHSSCHSSCHGSRGRR
jgi:hypothetical protein